MTMVISYNPPGIFKSWTDLGTRESGWQRVVTDWNQTLCVINLHLQIQNVSKRKILITIQWIDWRTFKVTRYLCCQNRPQLHVSFNNSVVRSSFKKYEGQSFCVFTFWSSGDNFGGTVVGEDANPYVILALWAVNGMSIVWWEVTSN